MRIGVVGGGVIGCSVAAELARRGGDVHLFEGRGIAAGATQASAGALVPFVEADEPGPLRDLTVRSLGMYDEVVESLRRDSRQPIDYARCGSLEVARTESEERRLREMIAHAPGFGLTWVERQELRNLEPSLAASARGAVLAPFHGYVSASHVTHAAAVAMRRRGGQLHSVAVTSVQADDDHAVVQDAGGAVHRFDRVVLATGSWGTRLRLEGIGSLPVRPVKGQLLRASPSERLTRILWSSSCYVVPQADGDVLIGATMEEAGFDEEPTRVAAEGLLRAYRELLPGIEVSVVAQRVGLRPATPDNLPVIGMSEARAVVHAVGHFRNGIVLAPLTAKLVADLILDGHQDPLLGPLSASRFR